MHQIPDASSQAAPDKIMAQLPPPTAGAEARDIRKVSPNLKDATQHLHTVTIWGSDEDEARPTKGMRPSNDSVTVAAKLH